MKVSIISNFHEDASISRSEMARKYFEDRGFEYELLYANFSHSLKKCRIIDRHGLKPIKTLSYNSNISIKRFVSHAIFAFKVFVHLIREKSDLIYLILPPNVLSLVIIGMLRNSSKLIVDVIDLWPEAFPMKNSFLKQIILFVPGLFSKGIRKMAINLSDFCIAESNFFFDQLNLKNKVNASVIHIKKFQNKSLDEVRLSNEFSIVYLGNIGHIYDFESLFKIIIEISRIKVCHLHIIGDGPRKKWFFEKLASKNIKYTYHGASFSEDLKYKVLSKCWFGYNGYLDDTEVALSYKSVDYLSYGVPLLNSAKSDTYELVNKRKIGFNFSKENLNLLIDKLKLIDAYEVDKLKVNSFKTFNELFSGQSLFNNLDIIISKIFHEKH
jgi:glycosyltransferase involved in cell wall biosynthesis